MNLCLPCLLLLGFLGAPPLLAIAVLFSSGRDPASFGKRIATLVSGGILVVWLVAAGGMLAYVQPWRGGILAHGHSPEGREYCVVQTFQDLTEPYRVSFYLRDAHGLWRWHYLAHEDTAWKKVVVKFSPAGALIIQDGIFKTQIPPDTEPLDPAKLGAGETYNYRPANFTAEDVLAFHDKWIDR